MKKIIEKKKSLITYVGNKKELKEQLKYLFVVHPIFKIMFEEKNIKNLSKQKCPFQTLNERLIYNSREISYGPNGSPQNHKFFEINYYSKLADEKFIKKHGKSSLEIILK